MKNITITFPDKSTRNYPSGITPMEIAESIGESLSSMQLLPLKSMKYLLMQQFQSIKMQMLLF